MRKRPFKFFFGLTLGIMAFMFLAKVFFFAFIIAGVMTLIFHFFRGIKYSLMDLDRANHSDYNRYENRRNHREPFVDRGTFSEEFDHLFRARRERIIKVL